MSRPGLGLALALALTAGGAAARAEDGPLPVGARADYQLGGAYPPPVGVTVVVRDSTDRPEPGYFNICYVNGFQTQPGNDWPADLLLAGPDGSPMADPDWPDEFLLDIATPAARAANLARVVPTLRACAEKGFDAVEFDNLDSFTRSGGRLDADDALAFAGLLVDEARRLGLPSGQKNTPELGTAGRKAGFAFAVAESCHRWNECAAYTAVYGVGQVLGIEYPDELRDSFADACADPDRPASLILRDRLLARPGEDDYLYKACP
jgi:hypothetical protein